MIVQLEHKYNSMLETRRGDCIVGQANDSLQLGDYATVDMCIVAFGLFPW